ncbi:MAG TPA: hypothetical protein VHZ32_16670 [Rhizomicrobium sp.]|jgi:hypothetical protein|nr:hypothetical protein [Rhizomicrobium sp.]
MKRLDAHSKLLSLLCLVLLASASLVLLSGCGGGLLPDQNSKSASPFQTYDQVVESFDQIVPGMTHAEDLPNLGFDARTGSVDVLSYVNIEERFLPAAGVRWEHLDPAVQACIRAELYCTGYVFHPSRTENKRLGAFVPDLLGFERITRSAHWSADVTLLVMNGRVIHKLFSGSPRTENLDDKRQPLGPLQDLGGALAHAAGSVPSY